MTFLNKWVTGSAVTPALGVAALLALVGNLFEGFGGQADMSVGSTGLVFLLGALAVMLIWSKPKWRTFQAGLVFLWSGLTAGLVYFLLLQIYDDVLARIDESVVLSAGPGLLLLVIATASRRDLKSMTRTLARVGLVTMFGAIPLLFVVEWSVIVGGLAVAISCGAWVYEAVAGSDYSSPR